MNKTIIININGIVFHIEEDAYEILKKYISDVKQHFANAEDSLEITTDIENRIAEMFTELLAQEGRQVIIEADVNKVIGQMGTVNEFETANDAGERAFGSEQGPNGGRKFFRDPDDFLVGGVCSGIASYFDIEPVWTRLIFGLGILFGGSSLIIYLILWIIIPKAITRADRMAMKGEKLNLQGFKKNFEEELKTVKENLKGVATGARPFIYKFRDFLHDFFQHFSVFLVGVGRLVVKLFGVIILLMCLSLFIASVVAFVSIMVFSRDIYHMFPLSIINYAYRDVLFTGIFALVIIPVVGLTMLTLNSIFKSRTGNRSTMYTLGIVWICALCVVGYYMAKILSQFKESASISQTIVLKPTKNMAYHLVLNEIKYLTREDSLRMHIDANFKDKVILDDDNEIRVPDNVDLYFEKSNSKSFELEERFSSQGTDYQDALLNSRKAVYHFTQHDSVLTFDKTLQLPYGTDWRNQKVELILKVPANTLLIIDERLSHLLRDWINVRDCNEKNKTPNATSAEFMMTTDGLRCKVDTALTDSTTIN